MSAGAGGLAKQSVQVDTESRPLRPAPTRTFHPSGEWGPLPAASSTADCRLPERVSNRPDSPRSDDTNKFALPVSACPSTSTERERPSTVIWAGDREGQGQDTVDSGQRMPAPSVSGHARAREGGSGPPGTQHSTQHSHARTRPTRTGRNTTQRNDPSRCTTTYRLSAASTATNTASGAGQCELESRPIGT